MQKWKHQGRFFRCFSVILRYTGALCLAVAVGFALLYIAGLDTPSGALQKRVDYKIEQSCPLLLEEAEFPTVFSLRDQPGGTLESTVLDNSTESTMLNSAKYMNTLKDPLSILSNPRFHSGQEINTLNLYLSTKGEEANDYYYRYWQGFRAFLRPMLWFLNYSAIREVLRFIMLSLLALTAASIRRHAGLGIAIAFALSMAMMEFAIISTQLQYAMCFAVAMGGMLALPRWRCRWAEHWLFFILGAMTQYLDFYTVPVVTLGLPLIYLMCLTHSSKGAMMRKAFGCIAAWAFAYAGMWFVRLVLAALLVDPLAFSNVFSKIDKWTGVVETENMAGITRGDAFMAVLGVCFSKAHIILSAVLAAVYGVYLLHATRKRRQLGQRLFTPAWRCLPVVLLPVAWIAVAYKATAWHACFQYRSICVVIFAVLCFLASLVWPLQEDGYVQSSKPVDDSVK